jgi:NitT/TauT family transport system substrate-binding protein
MGRPEALYIPYLKQHYGIDFNVIPQSFGMASFLQDKAFIQEGFFIAEPYYLEKAGAKVKWLPLWDSGYAPSATLFANNRFLEKYPEVTRRFLRAFIRGWQDYLENEPEPAHALIRQGNPRVDDAFLTFSRNQIIAYSLGRGGVESGETYGSLSAKRIAREIAILESIGALQPNAVTVESVLDLRFLPAPR